MTADKPMALIVSRARVTRLLVAVLAACDVNVPLGNLPGDAPGARSPDARPPDAPAPDGPPGRTGVGCRSLSGGSARVLVTGLGHPEQLVADDSHLYWVDFTGGGYVDTVMRVAKTGGTPQELATNQAVPGGIAIDGEAVYWINGSYVIHWINGSQVIERGHGQLMRLAKTGGEPTMLAAELDTLGALAVDDQYVYLSDKTFVERIPKLGGAPEMVGQFTIDSRLPSFDGTASIATDDHQVYFTLARGQSVHAVAKTGGEATAFARTTCPMSVVAVDGDVYWTEPCNYLLLRASSASDSPVALLPPGVLANVFSIASSRIYFSNVDGSVEPAGIYWIDRDGGAIHMLTVDCSWHFGIAVDDANVYFTTFSTVNVIAK